MRKEQKSLPTPGLLRLSIPFIYTFCINTLQCGSPWDCGSYGPCSLASVRWEAVRLFVLRQGFQKQRAGYPGCGLPSVPFPVP